MSRMRGTLGENWKALVCEMSPGFPGVLSVLALAACETQMGEATVCTLPDESPRALDRAPAAGVSASPLPSAHRSIVSVSTKKTRPGNIFNIPDDVFRYNK